MKRASPLALGAAALGLAGTVWMYTVVRFQGGRVLFLEVAQFVVPVFFLWVAFFRAVFPPRSARASPQRRRSVSELCDEDHQVNRKRIARLMRLEGLEGATRRRKWLTTKRGKDVRLAPDLVERDFAPEGPDRLWVADITYIPTGATPTGTYVFLQGSGRVA